MRLVLCLAAAFMAYATGEARATSCAPYPLTIYLRCEAAACTPVWATFPESDFGVCSRHLEPHVLAPDVARAVQDIAAASRKVGTGLYRVTMRFDRPLPPRTRDHLFRHGLPFRYMEQNLARASPDEWARRFDEHFGPGWLERIADVDDPRVLADIQERVAREAGEAKLASALEAGFHWLTFALMGLLLAAALHAFYRDLYAPEVRWRVLIAPIATELAVGAVAVATMLLPSHLAALHVLWAPVAAFALVTQLGSVAHVLVRGRDRARAAKSL